MVRLLYQVRQINVMKALVIPIACLLGLLMGYFLNTAQANSFPASNEPDFYRSGTYSAVDLTVQMTALSPKEIRYTVKLPDGTTFEIKSDVSFTNRFYPHFTSEDLKVEAEFYRKTLEGFGRVIHSGSPFDYAALSDRGNTLYTLELNQERLKKHGLQQLDPAKLAFESVIGRYSEPQTLKVDRVTFTLPASPENLGSSNSPSEIEITIKTATEKPQGMIKKTLQFLLDAMIISTKRAWTTHKTGETEIRRTWDERGLQLGIKVEFMAGIGRLNLARSMSVSFSIGYNRKSRSLVFRRGFRMEKMADGSNLSIGGKLELKRYRLNTASAFDESKSQMGLAKMSGQSWYPPMFLPVVSPVFETGRGYQSEGVSLAGNIADFGGSFLLNSVNSFEEAQRVYQTELPDPNRWLSDVVKYGEGFLNHRLGITMPNTRYTFITSPISRCEMAFSSVH